MHVLVKYQVGRYCPQSFRILQVSSLCKAWLSSDGELLARASTLRKKIKNKMDHFKLLCKMNSINLHHMDKKPNFILPSSNTHYSKKQPSVFKQQRKFTFIEVIRGKTKAVYNLNWESMYWRMNLLIYKSFILIKHSFRVKTWASPPKQINDKPTEDFASSKLLWTNQASLIWSLKSEWKSHNTWQVQIMQDHSRVVTLTSNARTHWPLTDNYQKANCSRHQSTIERVCTEEWTYWFISYSYLKTFVQF
jgi:hypothetical protein